jgi:hypothetical protein
MDKLFSLEEARLIAEATENKCLELRRQQDEIEQQLLNDLHAKQEEIAKAEATREAKELADEQVLITFVNKEACKAAEALVETDTRCI